MNIPDNLLYTKDHEWILIDGETATVGITDYAQEQLGDIVYVEVETVEEEVDANDVFGSVEAVKTVSDLYMPLTGTVTELNANLEDNPELINSDPYGEGWIIKVALADTSEIESLLKAADYGAMVAAG